MIQLIVQRICRLASTEECHGSHTSIDIYIFCEAADSNFSCRTSVHKMILFFVNERFSEYLFKYDPLNPNFIDE